jgi:hypothetical protein
VILDALPLEGLNPFCPAREDAAHFKSASSSYRRLSVELAIGFFIVTYELDEQSIRSRTIQPRQWPGRMQTFSPSDLLNPPQPDEVQAPDTSRDIKAL